MSNRVIRTMFSEKPIPNPTFDWEAWDENHEEKTGYGHTEAHAIRDLIEKLGIE